MWKYLGEDIDRADNISLLWSSWDNWISTINIALLTELKDGHPSQKLTREQRRWQGVRLRLWQSLLNFM